MPFVIAVVGGLLALLLLRRKKEHARPPDTGQAATPSWFGLRSAIGQSMPWDSGNCPPGSEPLPGGCSRSGFGSPGYATEIYQSAPPRPALSTVPPNQVSPQPFAVLGATRGTFATGGQYGALTVAKPLGDL